jgi:hypothetical protein
MVLFGWNMLSKWQFNQWPVMPHWRLYCVCVCGIQNNHYIYIRKNHLIYTVCACVKWLFHMLRGLFRPTNKCSTFLLSVNVIQYILHVHTHRRSHHFIPLIIKAIKWIFCIIIHIYIVCAHTHTPLYVSFDHLGMSLDFIFIIQMHMLPCAYNFLIVQALGLISGHFAS